MTGGNSAFRFRDPVCSSRRFPVRGLGRLVELFLAVLSTLLRRCVGRDEKPGQVPARRRLGQAFVLQSLVAGTWPDQVDPDRVHQVVADRIVVGCRRLLSSGHRALLRLALVPADASPASFSSRARSRFSARRRMRTSSRTSSGHRYRQGFFVRPDPSSSTS